MMEMLGCSKLRTGLPLTCAADYRVASDRGKLGLHSISIFRVSPLTPPIYLQTEAFAFALLSLVAEVSPITREFPLIS